MDMIRMTYPTAAVLQALDRDLRYGFEIAQTTGLRRGTVYPILRRLEEAGLVTSAWEAPEQPRDEGRPPRKYYRLAAEAAPLLERARNTYPLPEPAATTAAATRG
jgi:PadR family transcriptional regulator PadR